MSLTTTSPIAAILTQQPFVVLDGALATELERRGADLRDPLWSARVMLEEPGLIRAVQRDYLDAGADVVTTATYQASVEGFAARGLDAAAVRDILHEAVHDAIDVRDAFWREWEEQHSRPRPFVAGSVGPYGAYLANGSEYRGDYAPGEEALMDFHRPRLAALLEAGAECVACETIPTGEEARALARVLGEFPGAAAWISFSTRDGEHLANGEPIAEVVQSLGEALAVVAVGVNCTSPLRIPALVRALARGSALPIAVYPNSGETWDSPAHRWRGAADDVTFAQAAADWYAAGARLIGGCCRTTPDDIRAVAEWRGRLARS